MLKPIGNVGFPWTLLLASNVIIDAQDGLHRKSTDYEEHRNENALRASLIATRSRLPDMPAKVDEDASRFRSPTRLARDWIVGLNSICLRHDRHMIYTS